MLVMSAFQKQPHRVSVTMLIDAIKDQCGIVSQAEVKLSEARAERDDMLCELKALGVPDRSLVKLTGLSLSTVTKVTANARRSANVLILEAQVG